MSPYQEGKRRICGFTLIEVLVTVVVIGVLAAVIIPAIASQAGSGDTTRVLADLNNIRTGIEDFDIAVRTMPGDIDDLVNPIDTHDLDITSTTTYAITQTTAWAGPYIEQTVVSSTTGSPFFDAFPTGAQAWIDNRFLDCDISQRGVCIGEGVSPNYVVVLIRHITPTLAGSLNDLIDGPGETNASSTGRFRYDIVDPVRQSIGFYYATPFK